MRSNESMMDPLRLLQLVRPSVLVIDAFGTILAAHGGLGSTLGFDNTTLVGRNTLEFIEPAQCETVASYFLAEGTGLQRTRFPLPFRTTLVAADGSPVVVDTICTGLPDGDDAGWVVVLVPHDLTTTPTRAIDALASDRPLNEVLAVAAASLSANAPDGLRLHGCVLADRSGGRLRAVYGADTYPDLSAALRHAVSGGEPCLWDAHERGDVVAVGLDELPQPIGAAAVRYGFRCARLAPVVVGEAVEAALLGFTDNEPGPLFENVRQWFLGVARVTATAIQHHRSRAVLLAAATTDSLTGLANRRQFRDAAERAPIGTTVLYLDVDEFKQVNDRYGHDVGDRVLVEVARRIAAVCRPGDVVARLGGDEFAVLLADTDPETAAAIGLRVVAAVGQPLPAGAGPTHVTITLGAARHDGKGDAATTALRLADRSMLAAKHAKAHRVIPREQDDPMGARD